MAPAKYDEQNSGFGLVTQAHRQKVARATLAVALWQVSVPSRTSYGNFFYLLESINNFEWVTSWIINSTTNYLPQMYFISCEIDFIVASMTFKFHGRNDGHLMSDTVTRRDLQTIIPEIVIPQVPVLRQPPSQPSIDP